MSINLALSLLLGAGQLFVGAAFVYRIVAHGQWRLPKWFLLLTIAAWFVASGAAELFVSGMEVTHNIAGKPSLQVFRYGARERIHVGRRFDRARCGAGGLSHLARRSDATTRRISCTRA